MRHQYRDGFRGRNIIRALNVEFDDLERWKELVELKDEEGRKRYETKGAEIRLGDGTGQESGKQIWDAVARMRGWDTPA
jgi:conserved oligomeric Golgi complex subunit 7